MTGFNALVPLMIIVGGALCVLLLEAFLKKEDRSYLAYLSLAAVLGSAAAGVSLWDTRAAAFDGLLRMDNAALFLTFLGLIAAAFTVLIGMRYLSLQDANYGEFYGLVLLALSGLMIMVSSSNLVVVFLGLEVLSVSSYALAGLKRDDDRASEAAIKYFLMGSFASAFLIFGLALLFGASGTLDIPGLTVYFMGLRGETLLGLLGLVLVVVGFAFKIAIVPFQMWSPDVYEGAPTPVTAFFVVGPKMAGFAVLYRLLAPSWDQGFKFGRIATLLGVMAALTMLVASLTALRQRNVKRMFAYSSIANAGIMLIAVISGDGAGLVFYLTVYLFMSFGAFGSLIAMSRQGEEFHSLDDFAGIGFKYPWIGALFSVFLISMAGFPPFGGFLAKFFVFSEAIQKDMLALVLVGLLASLISAYYYLRIIVYMYMREPERDVEIEVENPALFLVLFLCLFGVLQLGLFPGNVLILIKRAVGSLLM
jgi:NADH-quinone oxidoreductase subunit N